METIFKGADKIKLMTHVVVGYPSLKETEKIVLAMAKAGASFVELQMPFSDPIADGPTIMQANQKALKNKIGMKQNLALMKSLSQQVDIPLLFMGYYNTILNYGVSKFCKQAAACGCWGLIVPDLPMEEAEREGFLKACKKNKLHNIFVVSPATTNARLILIKKHASGFIYCVARYGITGDKSKIDQDLNIYLKRVKKIIKLPVAVGFGISKPEQVRALRGSADIAIIGSAIIKLVNKKNKIHNIKKFINKII